MPFRTFITGASVIARSTAFRSDCRYCCDSSRYFPAFCGSTCFMASAKRRSP